MAHYDYRSLTAIDFEDLIQSLLQEELGIALEAFAPGRDQGVDLRHSRDPSATLIIQCKHYMKSGFPILLRELKSLEYRKILKLNPRRYILATSVSLTPGNKNKIVTELDPFIRTPQDIYGEDDISSLLSKFPHIAQRNIKLYLTSWSALTRAMHNDLHCSAELIMREARKKAKIYAPSDTHEFARNMLEKEGVCLISGPPGVGKTTLAEMLLLEHERTGWEVFSITNNVGDFLKVYSEGRNQIFIYDDFLGQISATEKLSRNESASLARVVEHITQDKSKRLILTTREYILRDAGMQYEALARLRLDHKKCIIEFHDYSNEIKATILYNHIFHSGLPEEWIRAVGTSGDFDDFVHHTNFVPRIIESIIKIARDKSFSAPEFLRFFKEKLDFPDEIWSHVFLYDIPSDARKLLLALASIEEQISLEALERLYRGLTKKDSYDAAMDFKRIHRVVERTFVRTDQTDAGYVVRLANPSIKDYLVRFLSIDLESLRLILNSAIFFSQLTYLWRLSADNSAAMRSYAQALRKHLHESCWRELIAAFVRTTAASGSLGLLSGVDDRASESLSTEVLESHFIEYCRIMDEIRQPVDIDLLRNMLSNITAGWQRSQGSISSCVQVLKFVHGKMNLSEDDLNSAVRMAKKPFLANEYHHYDDFDALLAFSMAFPSAFTSQELDPVRIAYEKWLQLAYPEVRKENPEVLEDIIHWLRSLAKLLDVCLDENEMEIAEERALAYEVGEHAREISDSVSHRMVISRITSIEYGEHVRNLCNSLAGYS